MSFKDSDFAPPRRTLRNDEEDESARSWLVMRTGRTKAQPAFNEEDFDESRDDKLAKEGKYRNWDGQVLPIVAPGRVFADPLVEEVANEGIGLTWPDEAKWEREQAVIKRSADALVAVASKDELLDKLATKLFKPVHVEGGPCQDAPAGERFVPPKGQFDSSGSYEVSCKTCLSFLAILEGEAVPIGPADAYAMKIRLGRWRRELIAKFNQLPYPQLVTICEAEKITYPVRFSYQSEAEALTMLRGFLEALVNTGNLDHGMPADPQIDMGWTGRF